MTVKCPECQFENPENTRFCGNCATQLQTRGKTPFSQTETIKTPIQSLAPGTTFAERYQIIEELGKGGMGSVYKVLDNEINEKIALKLIKPEIASDKKTIERFRNELKIARKIGHKHVCRMFHLGKHEGTHFITMEYLPGEDLKSFIRRSGQLTAGKSISIAIQVFQGLAEAHKAGVIHRDLKPQNIMIDKLGNAHIMDFGIARALKTKGITTEGVMVGTPHYMSPEQVEGKEADERSDIYSMGVILFEMVTGQVPFEGETTLSIALKHKTEAPPHPEEFNPQIPEALSRLILKCMEKDRESRYQDVEQLISELRVIEQSLSTRDRVIPGMKSTDSRLKPASPKMKTFLIPTIVTLSLAVIGVTSWLLFFRGDPKPPPSTPPKKEELLISGLENLKNKKYLEALKQFFEILYADPKNQEAQSKIGVILKDLEKTDDAISELEKIIALNPKEFRVYSYLGELFEKKQDREKAIFYFNKYLESAPEGPQSDRIKKKIKDLETRIQPKDKPKKKISKPLETEKEKLVITSRLNQGTKAFNEGNFELCIQHMEYVLRADPENATAQYFLTEAKKKKETKRKEDEIQSVLKAAEDMYQKENYETCIKLARQVLELDQDNTRAKEYLRLANNKMAPQQINALVSQFIRSLNNNDIVSFYKRSCSSQFYDVMKKDAELTSNLYEDLQSTASNIEIQEIQFVEGKAKVSFDSTITGISKEEGKRLIIFDGTYIWDLVKQDNHWIIINIRPEEKK